MSRLNPSTNSVRHSGTSGLDRRYVGFFECFNSQRFFEAHEVLEELWLLERGQPRADFYKGLIQLAGAFVHVQKARKQPALALLRLAQDNLAKYPDPYEQLSVSATQRLVHNWKSRIDGSSALSEILQESGPFLRLERNTPRTDSKDVLGESPPPD